MDHQIVSVKPFTLIGMELRTTNAGGAAAKEIPPFWGQFLEEGLREIIPNKLPGGLVGLYTDYSGDPADQPYSLIIGCKVQSAERVPSGMVIREIPEGKYALFVAEGKFPESLLNVWKSVWKSGLQRAFTVDFEIYPPDFPSAPSAQNVPEAPRRGPASQSPEIQVYVSIK